MVVVRRQIESHPHPGGVHGVGEVAHHVALAVLPGAVRDGIVRIRRRPETEPRGVLDDELGLLEASVLERGDPLAGVEVGGIEQRRLVDGGVAVLGSVEGVETEVQICRQLGALQGDLCRGWQRREAGRCARHSRARLNAGATRVADAPARRAVRTESRQPHALSAIPQVSRNRCRPVMRIWPALTGTARKRPTEYGKGDGRAPAPLSPSWRGVKWVSQFSAVAHSGGWRQLE